MFKLLLQFPKKVKYLGNG